MELLRKTGKKKKGKSWQYWGIFLCPYCEKESEKTLGHGKSGLSCGCMAHKYKHGLSRTRIYRVWCGIKDRCTNKKMPYYKNYGGRGISYCTEWNVFDNFKDWALINGYSDSLEIDRIDNDGNYNPANCRFVTHTINNRNKRNTLLTENDVRMIKKLYKPYVMTAKKVGEIYGVSRRTVESIIHGKTWKNV